MSALLICVLVSGGLTYERLREKDDALAGEVEMLRQRLNEGRTLPVVVDKEAETRLRQQRVTEAALGYPWSAVFDPVERAATVEGVGLLALLHDQAQGTTQLTVEALDVPTVLRYVDRLNEPDDRLTDWTLTGYQLQPRTIPQTIRAQIQSGPIREGKGRN